MNCESLEKPSNYSIVGHVLSKNFSLEKVEYGSSPKKNLYTSFIICFGFDLS